MVSETVHYNSPLGVLRITAENDAILEVHFLNDNEEPVTPVQHPVSPALRKCISQMDSYFSDGSAVFDVELSQKGTAFQKKYGHHFVRSLLAKRSVTLS